MLSRLIVGGRRHIYYGRSSLMLGNGVDWGGSAAGEILSRCSRVLVARIVSRQALDST